MNPLRPASRRARTAVAVLAALDNAEVEYCVLRNHQQVPTEPGRDIDLIALDSALPQVERTLIPIARDEGWDPLLRCTGHHEGTSYYLLRTGSTGVQQLEFHFTRVRWAGMHILKPEAILARRIRVPNGLWTADPIQVAVQRLLQFGLSGQLQTMKDEYWIQTRAQVLESSEAIESELIDVVGKRNISNVIRAVTADRRQETSELIQDLRIRFLFRSALSDRDSVPSALSRNMLRGTEHWRSARCGVVGVVPDKESSHALKTAIAPMFLNVRIEHSEKLNRQRRRSVVETVNRAGATLIVSSNTDSELQRRLWGSTAVRLPIPDLDAGIQAVVDRFTANHARL